MRTTSNLTSKPVYEVPCGCQEHGSHGFCGRECLAQECVHINPNSRVLYKVVATSHEVALHCAGVNPFALDHTAYDGEILLSMTAEDLSRETQRYLLEVDGVVLDNYSTTLKGVIGLLQSYERKGEVHHFSIVPEVA